MQEPDFASPGDRFKWLADQGVRYHQASNLRYGTADPAGEANDIVLTQIENLLADPEQRPQFLGWVTGKVQQRRKDLFNAKFAETGDAALAQKFSFEREPYQPPIATIDQDPELAKFDPANFQDLAGKNAFRDWLVEPVARYVVGRAQAITDLAIGVANMLPGVEIPAHDVYSRTRAAFDAITSGDYSNYGQLKRLAELRTQSYDESRGLGLKIVQGGATAAGNIKGMMTGPGKAIFGRGNQLAETLLSRSPKWAQAAAGSAAGFGTYNFIANPANQGQGGALDRSVDALVGGLAGTAAAGASALGRAIVRKMTAKAVDPLFKEAERQVASGMPVNEAHKRAFQRWATDSGLRPAAGELAEDFRRRVIASFVDAGAPGMMPMGRKLVGEGLRSLVEGGAMSMIDAHFLRNFFDGVMGDEKALKDAFEHYATTALGLGILNAGGSFQLLRHQQRAQPTEFRLHGRRGEPGPQGPTSSEINPKDGSGSGREVMVRPDDPKFPMPDGPLNVYQEPPAIPNRAVGEEQRFWQDTIQKAAAEDAQLREDVYATKVDDRLANAANEPNDAIELPYDMVRLGWTAVEPPARKAEIMDAAVKAVVPEAAKDKPALVREAIPAEMKRDASFEAPQSPRIFRLADSPYSYIIEGDVARPNARLREATGLPAKMPRDQFLSTVAKMTVVSQLQAKATLPGEEITATGWVADAKDVDGPGVVRTIRFGEVVERPLAPQGEWKPAKKIPVRKPDPIPQEQQDVASALQEVAKRPDLAPEDQAVLGASIGVLNTVSAAKDFAVAETVQALQSGALAQQLAGPPEAAAAAVKAVGEMLTTKSPEVALQDMQRKPYAGKTADMLMNEASAAATQAGYPELPFGRPDRSRQLELETGKLNKTQREYEATQMPSDKLVKKLGERKGKVAAIKQQIADETSAVRAHARARADYLLRSYPDLFKATSEYPFAVGTEEFSSLLRNQPKDRSGESGAVDIVSLLTAAARAPMAVVSRVLDRPMMTNLFEDYLGRLSRHEPAIVDRFMRSATETSKVRGELQPPIRMLHELGTNYPANLTDVRWDQNTRSGPDGFQLFGDQRFMARAGVTRSSMTRESAPYVEIMDDLYAETRQIAHDLGFEVGGKVVSEVAREVRRVQQTTADFFQLARKLDPDLIAAIAHWSRLTPADVERALIEDGFTDAKPLHRDDPIEHKSKLLIPAWIEIDGKTMRLIETRPVQHAERLVSSFSARAGLVAEFGLDRASQNNPTQPYSEVVKQARTPEGRELLKKVFREASGIKIYDEYQYERQIHDLLGPLASLYASLKLNSVRAAVQNIAEPLATASAVLGYVHVGKAMAEVARAFVTPGGMEALKQRMVDEGGFLRVTHEGVADAEGVGEKVQAAARLASAMFGPTQGVADLSIRLALGNVVDAMREGNGGAAGRALARYMRLDPRQAERLAAGRGTADEYDYLLHGTMARMTGQNETAYNKSAASEAAKRFMVKFMRYSIQRTQDWVSKAREYRNARTEEDRNAAAADMYRLLFGTYASGVVGKAAAALLTGGVTALLEAIEDSTTTWSGIGTTLASGVLGGMGSFLANAGSMLLSADKDDRGKAADGLLSAIAPVGMAKELVEGITSLVAGDKDQSPTYRGHSTLGKLWLMAQRTAPLLRDIDRGMLGLQPLAITTNPDVAASRSRMMQHPLWKASMEKRGVQGTAGEFNNLMRSFELELRDKEGPEGVNPSDMARRIDDELPSDKINSAIQSIRSRKQLDWVGDLTAEEQAEFTRYMGETRMATLRGYDRVLEAVADELKRRKPRKFGSRRR